jgi:hypothetical protein
MKMTLQNLLRIGKLKDHAPTAAEVLRLHLLVSANGPSKRKNTSENPHQSAPIHISRSRLRSQNIWALGAA